MFAPCVLAILLPGSCGISIDMQKPMIIIGVGGLANQEAGGEFQSLGGSRYNVCPPEKTGCMILKMTIKCSYSLLARQSKL